MKIITVHGIRSRERWDIDFASLDVIKNSGVEVFVFRYGYFNVFEFFMPFSRKSVIKKFEEFYSNNFDPNDPPNIICHSFGSYIFFSAIREYGVIKFNKVILCGSILNSNTTWDDFFDSKQIQYLLNDYGAKDWVVKYSRLVLKNGGRSGQIGFLNVPPKYQKSFEQLKNDYKTHSAYFLKAHMRDVWAQRFVPITTGNNNQIATDKKVNSSTTHKIIPEGESSQKSYKFNNKILRKEIFERIYANINDEDCVSYTELNFSGRIDDEGNYYASYSKTGITNCDLSEFPVSTSADAIHNFEEMDFQALDENNKKLQISNSDNSVQSKKFIVHFDNTIKKGEIFKLSYRFMWRETINKRTGDTDHFLIKNAKNIKISLNFTSGLQSARFFIIFENVIVQQLNANVTKEKDKTLTYYLEYENTNNFDGIIFYFEGSAMGNLPITRPIKSKSFPENEVTIVKCLISDIKKVYNLESEIEHGNAANEENLKQRLSMFNDGFLLAKENNKIVGYVESVIWNDWDFETFEEIKNFPLHYTPNGDTLYVIFLAVDEKNRGKKIGFQLMTELERMALKYSVKKIKLVAKDDLTAYYGKLGFFKVRELPYFLTQRNHKSTLMVKEL